DPLAEQIGDREAEYNLGRHNTYHVLGCHEERLPKVGVVQEGPVVGQTDEGLPGEAPAKQGHVRAVEQRIDVEGGQQHRRGGKVEVTGEAPAARAPAEARRSRELDGGHQPRRIALALAAASCSASLGARSPVTAVVMASWSRGSIRTQAATLSGMGCA